MNVDAIASQVASQLVGEQIEPPRGRGSVLAVLGRDERTADLVDAFDAVGTFDPGGADEVEEPGWQEQALCAQTDPEAFFPEKGGSTREAKRICAGCEVRAECLDYALAHDERFGIWGGLSERERRRLRRAAV
jgi:WhiB family transcriptional regulator, redox-sensing transcriptional regulator